MKLLPISSAIALLPLAASAQDIINTSAFYDPDFKVRREGATSGLLSLTVTNATVSDTLAAGGRSWTHTAGGYAQVRTDITAPILGTLANLDAQLAAYTQTTGDTLVFGREITTDANLLGIVDPGPAIEGLVNDLAGASVLYNWQAQTSVTGLVIAPEHLYRVDFTVTSGAGLTVNLLDNSTFGITNASVTGASNESAQLLDLLSVLNIGNNTSTGDFGFEFKSSEALNQLDFAFAATTGVGVTGLGGTAEDQNVLTFSNFTVTAVPEPSAPLLAGLFGMSCLIRRKR